MSSKVALLVPCTSRMCPEWKSMKDTHLYNYTLKTFLLTCDKEHEYILYIGYDPDDPIFSISKEQKHIKAFEKVFSYFKVKFVIMDANKGHLTRMWNQLFKIAYDEGCDYFYQCGDDIHFHTKGWVNDCIKMLKQNENVGIVGPTNNNYQIITQGFVSRCHMKIFGEFFPESILNWGCDDWYNHVYKPHFFAALTEHYCSNEGGKPRYDVNGDKTFWNNYTENVAKLRQEVKEMAIRDQDKIYKFMDSDEF
jgi:hypothetical protein